MPFHPPWIEIVATYSQNFIERWDLRDFPRFIEPRNYKMLSSEGDKIHSRWALKWIYDVLWPSLFALSSKLTLLWSGLHNWLFLLTKKIVCKSKNDSNNSPDFQLPDVVHHEKFGPINFSSLRHTQTSASAAAESSDGMWETTRDENLLRNIFRSLNTITPSIWIIK